MDRSTAFEALDLHVADPSRLPMHPMASGEDCPLPRSLGCFTFTISIPL